MTIDEESFYHNARSTFLRQLSLPTRQPQSPCLLKSPSHIPIFLQRLKGLYFSGPDRRLDRSNRYFQYNACQEYKEECQPPLTFLTEAIKESIGNNVFQRPRGIEA